MSPNDASSPTERTAEGAGGATFTIGAPPHFDETFDTAPRPVDTAPAVEAPGGGPGGASAPDDAPGEAAAIRAFEEANARASTPAERKLLRGLAERFDPAAANHGGGAPASGWGWLAAAAYEAVEAGSAFVAPRRLREILARWERDGFPTDPMAPRIAAERTAATGTVGAGRAADPSPLDLLGEGPDLPLPHGHGSRRTWAFAVGLLGEALDRATLAELVAGTAIVGYRDGEVTISLPDPARAEQLATTHGPLIARKLSEAMRRPIRLAVLTAPAVSAEMPPRPTETTPPRPTAAPEPIRAEPDPPAAEPVPPSFVVTECGLPSRQLWSATLAEIASGDEVSPANFDAWLRPTALIGRGGDGGLGSPLVVGVPHALAQRRVIARFLPPLRAAVAAVVGVRLEIEVAIARDWLAANPPRSTTAPAPKAEEVGA